MEKEEKQENGKSRKADKNKEISYMWKNGKKSRKWKDYLDEMAFYAYNKIRCLKNNMSIFIYIGFMSKEVDFNENDIPTKKEI